MEKKRRGGTRFGEGRRIGGKRGSKGEEGEEKEKDEKQRSAIEGGIGEGRGRGSGWIRVDRCDGLGVVPVRADRPPGITGPTAVGLLLEEFRNGRCTVHRQRGDRSRRYGPDVLLRKSRQMLQETSPIQRIPEQGEREFLSFYHFFHLTRFRGSDILLWYCSLMFNIGQFRF